MSSSLSLLPVSPTSYPRRLPAFSSPGPRPRICTLTCCANSKNPKSPPNLDSGFGNALLKLAWYGSEVLGIAASTFRKQPQSDAAPVVGQLDVAGDDGMGAIDRALVVETIKKDFERSYFVTDDSYKVLLWNLTLKAYEKNCEFADPAGSFKGLQRFKRNCTNFGSLLDKSDMKLTKWEDFEVCPDNFLALWNEELA
ncbi:hypothetical protein ACLOJK_000740 [Asimina triloba]